MLKLLSGFVLCAYEYHSEAKKSIISLNFKNQSKGTSFAFSKSGLALSTFHCIGNDEATTKDGGFIKIIASDQEIDIVLLQLPSHNEYNYLKFGDSDLLVPGEELYHYGYALNSLIGNKGFYQGSDGQFIFASTEMMHGQSGGPVLNSNGQVVAVCKGHFYCTPEKVKERISHSGPSMYVPINKVKAFLTQYCDYSNGHWSLKSKINSQNI